MKFFLALLCVCLAACQAKLSYIPEFTADDAVKLAKQLTVSELESLKDEVGVPPVLQEREIIGPDGKPVDLSSEVLVDPNGYFCCHQEHIQNENWNTVHHTKVVHEYKLVSHLQRTGYTECGSVGWSRCSLYKEAYSQQLFTYTQTVEAEEVKFCPDEYITCCYGHTKLKDGNCLRLGDLHSNPALGDSLCRMARLGLLQSHQKPTKCPSDEEPWQQRHHSDTS